MLLFADSFNHYNQALTSLQNYHLNAIVSDFHLLNTIENPDDPLDPVTFIGVGTAGGAVKPDFKNKLVRGFKLQQLGGELGDQLKLQKDQAAIDAAQMVPVVLENGQTAMVPAKSAAEYGRRHGMTPEQAEEFLQKEGATVY